MVGEYRGDNFAWLSSNGLLNKKALLNWDRNYVQSVLGCMNRNERHFSGVRMVVKWAVE